MKCVNKKIKYNRMITIEFNISDNGYFYGSAGDLVKKQNFKAFVVFRLFFLHFIYAL